MSSHKHADRLSSQAQARPMGMLTIDQGTFEDLLDALEQHIIDIKSDQARTDLKPRDRRILQDKCKDISALYERVRDVTGHVWD